MNSALYVGEVRHRRFTPVSHRFNYPFFMAWIDLDEVNELSTMAESLKVDRFGWASFQRRDYMGGGGNTKLACQDKLEQLTGERLTGKVYSLCNLRYLGLYFSPVNFYYLYDDCGQWRYMLAEVSNTPWNERHYYAIPAGKSWHNKKSFHVSPFNPIEQDYHWRLKEPGDALFVHLENCRKNKEFDATLAMTREPLTSESLRRQLKKAPFMTAKIIALIYWHALKLFIKGAPFYGHPGQPKPKTSHEAKE